MTIARISGKSLTTTGSPAARLSKSLFGVESRWLSVDGWIGMVAPAGTPVAANRVRQASRK